MTPRRGRAAVGVCVSGVLAVSVACSSEQSPPVTSASTPAATSPSPAGPTAPEPAASRGAEPAPGPVTVAVAGDVHFEGVLAEIGRAHV